MMGLGTIRTAAENALVSVGLWRPAATATEFWRRDDEHKQQMAHWKAGVFASGDAWDAMGREHLELYDYFARAEGKDHLRRVIEWGCGGGCNAVHFAQRAQEFVGVDVSSDTAEECARQVSLATNGRASFRSFVVRPTDPEDAKLPSCDLFLCTYVFELVLSPEIGLRILDVAAKALEPGGLAIIQIRYGAHRRRAARYDRRPWDYTRYELDEFWRACDERGLEPRAVKLVPVQPLNGGSNYAYFLLRRRG